MSHQNAFIILGQALGGAVPEDHPANLKPGMKEVNVGNHERFRLIEVKVAIVRRMDRGSKG